jgi:hypothetical protein
VRVRGFAELTYADSARLSFARACERAPIDITLEHPHAWVVDDRRISFALDADLAAQDLAAHRALLEDLAKEASSGEAYLDAEGLERWSLLVGQAVSGVPLERTSGAEALDDPPIDLTTIRANRA